jgi:hypothetical protein
MFDGILRQGCRIDYVLYSRRSRRYSDDIHLFGHT